MKLEGDCLRELAKLGSSLHFVSLRMTDTCVFKRGVVGGAASNHPPLLPDSLNTCHSERSEESHNFSWTLL